MVDYLQFVVAALSSLRYCVFVRVCPACICVGVLLAAGSSELYTVDDACSALLLCYAVQMLQSLTVLASLS